MFCMFFSRTTLKIHGAPGCLFLSFVSHLFWHSPKTPQQETKLEKGCIQSLEENACRFHENRLSIGAVNGKHGVFFRSRFPRVGSIVWFTFQSVLEHNILQPSDVFEKWECGWDSIASEFQNAQRCVKSYMQTEGARAK